MNNLYRESREQRLGEYARLFGSREGVYPLFGATKEEFYYLISEVWDRFITEDSNLMITE